MSRSGNFGKTPPPKVHGILTTYEGQVFNPFETGTRELPAKQSGKHRWVALASYFLFPEEAEAASTPGHQVLMGMSNILSYGISCWDCEQPYPEVKHQPCAAADEWTRHP